AFHGDREPATCAEAVDLVFQTTKLIAIIISQTNGWLDSLLPTAIKEQAFLRRETEEALVPDPVFQHAQFFKKLTHIRCFGPGHRNVVGSPGVRGDFVFAPA